MPKTPKQTIRKILKVSSRLFCQQGFECVKMQDILDKLRFYGLSKGAVYHHFRNKEDILHAILAHYECHLEKFCDVQQTSSNARDKLKAIIMHIIQHNITHKDLIRSSFTLLQNPKAISYRLHNAHHTLAPILESLIQEGNADGSLSVAYPQAASQTLAWGVCVWLDVAFYPLQEREYIYKVRHLRMMLEGVGLNVIDENIASEFLEVWRVIWIQDDNK